MTVAFNGYFTSIGLQLAGSIRPAVPFTPHIPLNIQAFHVPTISSGYIEKDLSLQSGKFISEWKHAKVLPLFKSGSLMETNNYTPISILPILSKLLEHYVHACFSEYLEIHNLLTIIQSGFRRLHSTVTSQLQVTDG